MDKGGYWESARDNVDKWIRGVYWEPEDLFKGTLKISLKIIHIGSVNN